MRAAARVGFLRCLALCSIAHEALEFLQLMTEIA